MTVHIAQHIPAVKVPCPHCHKTCVLSLSAALGGPVAQVPDVRPGNGRQLQGEQVEAEERLQQAPVVGSGSGGCVQATPQNRCPACGLATRIVYGERKKDGRPYMAMVCGNRQCDQAGEFLPGSFRWKKGVGAASEAA